MASGAVPPSGKRAVGPDEGLEAPSCPRPPLFRALPGDSPRHFELPTCRASKQHSQKAWPKLTKESFEACSSDVARAANERLPAHPKSRNLVALGESYSLTKPHRRRVNNRDTSAQVHLHKLCHRSHS